MNWDDQPRHAFGQLRAISNGAGPLVLCLHGVGLRAEAFAAQIDAIVANGFRVLAPDMVGHGATPYADTSSLADYVKPLVAALDLPAVVIGHSMGAQMAIELAAQSPQLVRGVVALNAIYRRPQSAQQAVMSRAATLDGTSQIDPATTLERWFGQTGSSARQACARWLTTMDPRAYKSAYTAFAQSDGPEETTLRTMTCPALFMTGAEEPNSTPAMSQALAKAAPKATAHVLSGTAHMMPMTHASEVSAALLAFLKTCDLEPGRS